MLPLLEKKNLTMMRNFVQVVFALFLLYVGYQFYRFVLYFDSNGSTEYVSRPPAVEGFLPINALISLKSWLANGIFDPVHPAGLTIFLAIIIISLLYKKGFCSWLCPIGALSEAFWRAGRRIFKRNFKLPRFLDYFLMGIKYLLLGFFVKFIWFGMSGEEAYVFSTQIPYIKIADVKMLDFFINLSATAVIVLGFLAVASLFIKNFWCRYLCPYGALLGIISLASPLKITRNQMACTSCGICSKNCQNSIDVAAKTRVYSPECSGCLDCVGVCPVKGALDVAAPPKLALPALAFPVLMLTTYMVIIFIAKASGNWETSVTFQEYQFLIPQRNMFGH